MTLEEAIRHCEENAQKERGNCNNQCAEEHDQLKNWLMELKELKQMQG